MDILIRGVPTDELFSVVDVVNKFCIDYKDKPMGIYHGSVYGQGEVENWKPRFGVYKVKSGVVVKWLGEQK